MADHLGIRRIFLERRYERFAPTHTFTH
jgi:hypothetical protein